MHPVVQSCAVLLRIVRAMIDTVRASVDPGGRRPEMLGVTAARRFARGVRMVEAYLRRLLLSMALELEPNLVDRSKAVERMKARKRRTGLRHPRFVILGRSDPPLCRDALDDLGAVKVRVFRRGRRYVAMSGLYHRLDRLALIAQDPLGRARRLAFHLARFRPGFILAPDRRVRLPVVFGTEASASFNALGFSILHASRSRPPPLPPPKRWGPSVTILHWW